MPPVHSSLMRFQVLKNLFFIEKVISNKRTGFGDWIWESHAKQQRDKWVVKMMRRRFSEDDVQRVLSYRRSAGSDEAVIADFMTNEFPQHHIVRDEHYNRAIRVVTEQMRPRRILKPVAFPDLRGYKAKLNTSAELPWTNPDFKFQPRGRDYDLETGKPRVNESHINRLRRFKNGITVPAYLKWKQELELIKDSAPSYHNLYNEIFGLNRDYIHMIKDGMLPFWKNGQPVPYERLQLHLRTHVTAQGKPDKVRAVFGAPKLLLHSELMFIWPLQATYQNTNTGRLLWGREIARGGWTKIMNEFASETSNTYISMDWSSFDRRLLHELIDDVHKIWRGYYDFTGYEPTTRYPDGEIDDPQRLERLWTWMTNAIKRTPIELPNGEIWGWRHNGFGSGYQQTQLMDSFCNMIMTYTVLSSLGINIESNTFKSRFQGDDAILAFSENSYEFYGNGFLSMMKEKSEYYFNAILSDEKSTIGDHYNDLFVLGYNNIRGTPVRTDEDLLSHLMYPESPQDYGRLAASALGMAYSALGCSHNFYLLCKDIYDEIVLKRGFEADFKALKWMKKAGMDEILEQIKDGEFPTFLQTLAMGYSPVAQTERDRESHWPTIPQGIKGEIIFIDRV